MIIIMSTEHLIPSESKEYNEAHFIYQNIYLGSLLAANDYFWLKENGIG